MSAPVIIAAMSRNRVIGAKGTIPWREPEDMKFFKSVTMHHPVIMGRKTWDSLGKWAPLPGRLNIVISRTLPQELSSCIVVRSLDEALARAACETTLVPFIIGGAEIYQQALPLASTIYLTEINYEVEGDTFFPELGPEWEISSRRFVRNADSTDITDYRLAFNTYVRLPRA